ncbi:GNAT family N-acetyltransferase [Glutamicibacter sp.]|uniref:GNAT family N-acetyltransferase n=1 Tax=Glutamicibacter sp. TaxID=1931995 RepID=UPI002B46CFDE|nr:GNAT family N-acetyltransferase [Glutamicibacter sp.]HJX78727.1 GNAT family N-acetyltransferase [Glutamicibacter sp.]
MPIEIEYARDPHAVRNVLESLPEWFGDLESIDDYIVDAANEKFVSVLARESGVTIGVSLIRRHFSESAELHLIAISPEARGHGIGRTLIEKIAADLANDGCVLLSVHTVGPTFDNEAYAQTRSFYRATGFYPLEEHSNLDWSGPTLILVRPIAPAR